LTADTNRNRDPVALRLAIQYRRAEAETRRPRQNASTLCPLAACSVTRLSQTSRAVARIPSVAFVLFMPRTQHQDARYLQERLFVLRLREMLIAIQEHPASRIDEPMAWRGADLANWGKDRCRIQVHPSTYATRVPSGCARPVPAQDRIAPSSQTPAEVAT